MNPKQERKRIYWKDVIEQEEKKLESRNAEQEAERLKLDGKPDKDDENKKEIGSVNPIADFKRMITDRKQDLVAEALDQMQKMIKKLIISSMNEDLFDKAMDCLQAMREGCVDEDEAESFNDMARQLKAKHADFFKRMQQNQIGLISKHESHLSSKVTQE